jgi:hypothetical protein
MGRAQLKGPNGKGGGPKWDEPNRTVTGELANVVVLAGHEGDQSSAPTTSIMYRCSLVPQDFVPRQLALNVTGDVSGRGYLIEVKMNFTNEMITRIM